MKNLNENNLKSGKIKISNTQIDESVLQKKHYVLANFTTEDGQAYAININNNIAYPVIGKRFDVNMKSNHPSFSDARCMTYKNISLSELNR